jgi:type IV pilus assembly protein PilC
MINFQYTALNPKTGQRVKSTVQAENEQAAAGLIRKEELVPINIKSLDQKSIISSLNNLNRIKTKDKVLFSRQLSTLINAGLPIIQSLRAVDEQTDNKPFKIIIQQIITDVEGGSTLAKAMSKHPKEFNQVYISLVEAGETSGTLDKALERLAMQQEKDSELMSKVRGAMAYPIIVLLVMCAVVGFMLIKVLPQVQILYKGLPGAHLPIETTVLLDVSHFVTKLWWIIIIIVIVLVVAITRWSKAGLGRQVFDKLKMRIWPVGPLFMKMYMARFCRTSSTLVGSGVPLIQVLEVTGQAVNNVYIEKSIQRAIEKVKGGVALSEAIRNDPNFLSLVPNMLGIGEQSGATEVMLGKAADYYEKEVDGEIASISSIIEPVLMVVLGIVAFTIVAAVLLPIYGLAGQNFVQI